jgi:hypothetical protein
VRREEKRNEECRRAIQQKNNMRKIMLQKMTKINKETYLERRRRANNKCRERKREVLKRQIKVNREIADTRRYCQTVNRLRKYCQTVNRLRKGFQLRLYACKDNSGKLIEGEDKILEH